MNLPYLPFRGEVQLGELPELTSPSPERIDVTTTPRRDPGYCPFPCGRTLKHGTCPKCGAK